MKGKTELSLIHFVHTNPKWKMPGESRAFLEQLREQATRERLEESGQAAPLLAAHVSDESESALGKSLYHLQSLVYNSAAGQPNLISKWLSL